VRKENKRKCRSNQKRGEGDRNVRQWKWQVPTKRRRRRIL